VIRSLPILLFMAVLLFGCHTDVIREPRPLEIVLSTIGGTWHATKVMLDGVEKDGFDAYTITFSEAPNDLIDYKINLWPVIADLPDAGILKLGNNILSELELEDGRIIHYVVMDSKLLLTYRSLEPVTGNPVVEIMPMWTIEYEKVK